MDGWDPVNLELKEYIALGEVKSFGGARIRAAEAILLDFRLITNDIGMSNLGHHVRVFLMIVFSGSYTRPRTNRSPSTTPSPSQTQSSCVVLIPSSSGMVERVGITKLDRRRCCFLFVFITSFVHTYTISRSLCSRFFSISTPPFCRFSLLTFGVFSQSWLGDTSVKRWFEARDGYDNNRARHLNADIRSSSSALAHLHTKVGFSLSCS